MVGSSIIKQIKKNASDLFSIFKNLYDLTRDDDEELFIEAKNTN